MFDEIIGIIGSVGFPIAVSLYLLMERNKGFKQLTDAINNNTLIITKLCERLDK